MYMTIDKSHDASALGKMCPCINSMLNENCGQNHKYVSIGRRIYSISPSRLKQQQKILKLIIPGKDSWILIGLWTYEI